MEVKFLQCSVVHDGHAVRSSTMKDVDLDIKASLGLLDVGVNCA